MTDDNFPVTFWSRDELLAFLEEQIRDVLVTLADGYEAKALSLYESTDERDRLESMAEALRYVVGSIRA